jgi:hypothetical protein
MARSEQEIAMDKKLDEIRSEIQKNATGRNYLTGTEGVAGMINGLAEIAKTGVSSVAALAEKSMDNTVQAADITNTVTNIIKSFGVGGRLAGDALGFFANIITGTVDNWQKFSHEGLNFAGSAMAFRESVMKTGMSFQEFGDSLDKIKPALFQLGGGINGGMEAFGIISKVMNDPEMQTAFNRMGVLPKEANEILALTIRLGRANNISQNEAGQQELIRSTLSLAREMDAMAKLTGISRREQQKGIETMENDARVRARMAQLMNDPTKRAAIGNIISSGAALPPEAQKALSETIATAGIMTSEKLAELNQTYGADVANQFVRIGRLSEGTAEDQAEAARITKELFPMMAQARMQMAYMVRNQVNETAMGKEAFVDMRFQNYENTILRLMRSKEEGGEGLSQPEAEKTARQRAYAQADGMLIKDIEMIVDGQKRLIRAERDDDGNYTKKDPRAYATQMVTTAASAARAIGTELNAGAKKINDELLEMKTVIVNGKEEIVFTDESLKLIQYANGAGADGKNIGESLGKEFTSFIEKNTTALTALPQGLADAVEKLAGKLGFSTLKDIKPKDEINEQLEKDKKNKQNNGTPVSVISPNLNTVIARDLPTAVAAVQTSNENVVALTEKMPDSNLMAQQLEKISIIMASVETTMKEANGISKKIADNTFGMSGYVA